MYDLLKLFNQSEKEFTRGNEKGRGDFGNLADIFNITKEFLDQDEDVLNKALKELDDTELIETELQNNSFGCTIYRI